MKVNVFVDVWNCSPRAWLQVSDENVPTTDLGRLLYFDIGQGKLPKLEEDIYEILSKNDRKKVDKLAEPINISGWRGTITVSVSKVKLLAYLLKKKIKRINELEKKHKTEIDKLKKKAEVGYDMAKAVIRGCDMKFIERLAKDYCKLISDEHFDFYKCFLDNKGKLNCSDVVEIDGKRGKVVRSNSKDAVIEFEDGTKRTYPARTEFKLLEIH